MEIGGQQLENRGGEGDNSSWRIGGEEVEIGGQQLESRVRGGQQLEKGGEEVEIGGQQLENRGGGTSR